MANTEATRPAFWVQLASTQHSAISTQSPQKAQHRRFPGTPIQPLNRLHENEVRA
jgi:hypothetical protein